MSTPVFRCSVSYDKHVSTSIETGVRVMVEGEPFVSMYDGLYMTRFSDDWKYSRREAELSVVSQLERYRSEIDQAIQRIKGLPPALDPESALHSSAAGGAQAEVAT
jgi:hypothetical protein